MLEETGARGHEERVLVGGEAGGPGSEPIEGKKERGYKGRDGPEHCSRELDAGRREEY